MGFPHSDVLTARHRAGESQARDARSGWIGGHQSRQHQVSVQPRGKRRERSCSPRPVFTCSIDFRYQESVRGDCRRPPQHVLDLRIWPVPASYDEALIEMLSEPGMPAKLGIEAAHLTVARKEWLERTSASTGIDRQLDFDRASRRAVPSGQGCERGRHTARGGRAAHAGR